MNTTYAVETLVADRQARFLAEARTARRLGVRRDGLWLMRRLRRRAIPLAVGTEFPAALAD